MSAYKNEPIKLLVSEKFVSLQGEGVSCGVPAAFLRLGGCNLTCHYCDTAYSWDESRFDLAQELTQESATSVAQWIKKEAPGRLIVTGGEPLIQQKQLVSLLSLVDEELVANQSRRLFVEVETNGTIAPLPRLAARVDQWNVSPKLRSAQVDEKIRLRKAALLRFVELGAYFKFVVESARDVDEVDALAFDLGLTQDRVLLMPQAASVEVLRERAPEVAAWATSRAYRYSGRLHLELFGGRRGT